MRLLLIEDDRMIGDSLRAALRGEGWAVDWVRDASAAAAAWSSEAFDLVLLDLGLPPGGPAGGATDRKSTRLNSSHSQQSRMPSSA